MARETISVGLERHRFVFSLRDLFWLTAVAAVGAGWIANAGQQSAAAMAKERDHQRERRLIHVDGVLARKHVYALWQAIEKMDLTAAQREEIKSRARVISDGINAEFNHEMFSRDD
jgi:hypothetical protein